MTETGVIGLLGTGATIRQAYVDNLEAEFAQGKTLLRHAAPELVEAAEAKLRGAAVDPAAIAHAVDGLRGQWGGERIATVVHACTHFPLLGDELAAAFGPDVRFVHGAEGIARRVAYLTQGQEFRRTGLDFALITGDLADAEQLAEVLQSYGLERILRL
jgi:glutamate racemase